MEKYMYNKCKDVKERNKDDKDIVNQETENSTRISKDVVDVLIDAAAGEVAIKAFESALETQMHDVKGYKTAIKLFGNSIKHSIDALTTMHRSMLAVYQENWAFYRELQLCFQDEKKVWENFQRDVLEILPLFRKYESWYEAIEEKVNTRNTLLEKLKILNNNVNELKTRDNQKKTIRKLEKELEKVEKCYLTTHKELMEEYPKALASRVKCLCQMFAAFVRGMKEFSAEIHQVHKISLDFIHELPKTNPKIAIGDESNKVVISLRQTKLHQLSKKSEFIGLPLPTTPPHASSSKNHHAL